jgi:hypothetical protein
MLIGKKRKAAYFKQCHQTALKFALQLNSIMSLYVTTNNFPAVTVEPVANKKHKYFIDANKNGIGIFTTIDDRDDNFENFRAFCKAWNTRFGELTI